jgi:superfamily II DNA or RNA helicase
VLIATSVLYEGIDVQACNMVVMYSSLPTGVVWIQASGRARMKKGVTKIMYYDKGDVEELLVEKAWCEAEKILKWIHHGVQQVQDTNGGDDDDFVAGTNYIGKLNEMLQRNGENPAEYEYDEIVLGLPTICTGTVVLEGKNFEARVNRLSEGIASMGIRIDTKKKLKSYAAYKLLLQITRSEVHENKVKRWKLLEERTKHG